MMVDTLTIARELKAADLPEAQAEAIASIISRQMPGPMRPDGLPSSLHAAQVKLDDARFARMTESLRGTLIRGMILMGLAVGLLVTVAIKL